MKVYHFTSEDSLSKIISTNKFYPSYLNPQMDTAFGEGWYFTDLNPDTTPDEDLQQALWLRKEPIKSKRYIAFEIHDSLLQYCRPHVWRLKIDVVSDKVIDINTTYNLISSSIQAIIYITHGIKKIVAKLRNPWS
ncbi:MAG: HYD1 signature containing ADP-ribosyltransferase family protein [Ignavibacteria bacterium]